MFRASYKNDIRPILNQGSLYLHFMFSIGSVESVISVYYITTPEEKQSQKHIEK